MEASKFINEISEILFGCREACESKMLYRARELVQREKEYLLNKHVKKLGKAVYTLIDIIEEIENDN